MFKQSKTEELQSLAIENAELLIREHSPVKGAKNAKGVLVEFLDPECETCRAFHPFVKKLMEENPGKIQNVIRYAPFHGNS